MLFYHNLKLAAAEIWLCAEIKKKLNSLQSKKKIKIFFTTIHIMYSKKNVINKK